MLPIAWPLNKAHNHDMGILFDRTSGAANRQAESSHQAHDPRPSGTAPNPNNVNKETSWRENIMTKEFTKTDDAPAPTPMIADLLEVGGEFDTRLRTTHSRPRRA
jgi:hypothetical protein